MKLGVYKQYHLKSLSNIIYITSFYWDWFLSTNQILVLLLSCLEEHLFKMSKKKNIFCLAWRIFYWITLILNMIFQLFLFFEKILTLRLRYMIFVVMIEITPFSCRFSKFISLMNFIQIWSWLNTAKLIIIQKINNRGN